MTVRSAVPLPDQLTTPAAGSELTELTIDAHLGTWDGADRNVRSALESCRPTATPVGRFRLYRGAGCSLLCAAEVADFLIMENRIVCRLASENQLAVAQLCLLGPVLALWLERCGIPALHASVLCRDQAAIAIVADAGTGKSSVAMTLLRNGWALLSDDILAAEQHDATFLARPSYPQIRLWPSDAARFLEPGVEHPRVFPTRPKLRIPRGTEGFGRFCAEKTELRCIYLLHRRRTSVGRNATGIAIRRVEPQRALIELIRHSFAAEALEVLGAQRQRLSLLAALARSVPVCSLSYPSGWPELERVERQLTAELQCCTAAHD